MTVPSSSTRPAKAILKAAEAIEASDERSPRPTDGWRRPRAAQRSRRRWRSQSGIWEIAKCASPSSASIRRTPRSPCVAYGVVKGRSRGQKSRTRPRLPDSTSARRSRVRPANTVAGWEVEARPDDAVQLRLDCRHDRRQLRQPDPEPGGGVRRHQLRPQPVRAGAQLRLHGGAGPAHLRALQGHPGSAAQTIRLPRPGRRVGKLRAGRTLDRISGRALHVARGHFSNPHFPARPALSA